MIYRSLCALAHPRSHYTAIHRLGIALRNASCIAFSTLTVAFGQNVGPADADHSGTAPLALTPRPLITTDDLLGVSGLDYAALHRQSAQLLSGSACLPFVVHAPAHRLAAAERFVAEGLEKLAGSLSIAPLPADVAPAPTAGHGLPGRRLRDAGSLVREVGALLERSTPSPAPAVHVVLVGGRFGRSCGLVSTSAGPAILVGSGVIDDGRTSYLLHAFGTLAGLFPLWAETAECQQADDLDDTPHHSAPNYDCRGDHLSGCTNREELDANYMDARYCELAYTWTPQQARRLLDYYVGFRGGDCEGVPPDDPAGDCGLRVYPNPARRGALGQLSLVTDDDAWLRAGEVTVAIGTPLRELRRTTIRYEGAERVDATGLLEGLRLREGQYLITATAADRSCAIAFQVTE